MSTVGIMKRFAAGERLFTAEQAAENLYLILSGTVATGSAKHSAGGCVGQEGFLDNAVYGYEARAMDTVIALAFDAEAWEEVASLHPGLHNAIMAVHRRTAAGSDNVLPPDHPQVSGSAPASHDAFTFPKEAACPLCDSTFETLQVRQSRLRLVTTDWDFRLHYKDFEPLWYHVWVCPHCWYAVPHTELLVLRPTQKQRLEAALENLRGPERFQFSTRRTAMEVIRAHYLALRCLDTLGGDTGRRGMLWQRLAWLYQDAGLEHWEIRAKTFALELLEDSYLHSSKQRLPEQDQRLQLLLGELCVGQDRIEDGLRYVRSAYKPQGGHPALNRQAQDRALEFKSLRKE